MVPCLLLLLFQTGARAEATTVTYKDMDRNIVVAVRINGKTARMVLDTGASMSVIDPTTAKRLGLPPTGDRVRLAGVSGQVMTAEVHMMREVRLGKARAFGIKAAVRPIPHLNKAGVAGLLGQDFLSYFEVNLNARRKTVTLKMPTEKKKSERELRIESALSEPRQPLGPLVEDLAAVFDGSLEPAQRLDRLGQLALRQEALAAHVALLSGELIELPNADLNLTERNHLQRFLFCSPGYRRDLRRVARVIEAARVQPMTAPEELAALRQHIRQAENCYR